MITDDQKKSKVVRYSDFKEKQIIQWDDQGRAFYPSNSNTKYPSVNRNLDICLADNSAG